MEQTFWSSMIAGLLTNSVIAFLFWTWLTGKFKVAENEANELKAKIKELEDEQDKYLLKDDFRNIRREDNQALEKRENNLEKQIESLRQELRQLPTIIATLLKQNNHS